MNKDIDSIDKILVCICGGEYGHVADCPAQYIPAINKTIMEDLNKMFDEMAKRAIVTLDSDPVGIDKAKSIPVGKFIRLNDVKAIMQKVINDSLAVS